MMFFMKSQLEMDSVYDLISNVKQYYVLRTYKPTIILGPVNKLLSSNDWHIVVRIVVYTSTEHLE